jgi:hypothetical protein
MPFNKKIIALIIGVVVVLAVVLAGFGWLRQKPKLPPENQPSRQTLVSDQPTANEIYDYDDGTTDVTTEDYQAIIAIATQAIEQHCADRQLTCSVDGFGLGFLDDGSIVAKLDTLIIRFDQSGSTSGQLRTFSVKVLKSNDQWQAHDIV